MSTCRFCDPGNPCRFHRDNPELSDSPESDKNWLPDDLKDEFFRLGGGFQVLAPKTDRRKGRGYPGWKKKSLAEKQAAMKFKHTRGY